MKVRFKKDKNHRPAVKDSYGQDLEVLQVKVLLPDGDVVYANPNELTTPVNKRR